ncbi:carbonic anhydrase 6 isoform X1 [Neomonachus schauinslandi]|uniref:Carbonic anhydrase n=1 Tax=Neomonachus schauinslandi TaxID=29088 RepID=A0A8M1M9V9_NEOSC|nr:carbonic anhydrase 6 isoform X1 [Neomonachus schauinslandi]
MRASAPLLALLLLGARAQHSSEWTYSEGALDEAHWPREYPTCGGTRQSPIDLQRRKVQYNPSLKALNLSGYEVQAGEFPMVNNGHTVQISLPPSMRMTASDGTQYIAEQLHFHWGGASSEISGSEHTIDGIRFVAEIHIVHYNSKYKSYDIAQSEPDGLAVLAALVEVTDFGENTYYSNFIAHLNNIRYPGQSMVLSGLDILDMLPENVHHYYSYRGSLTTPPCTENVHWFVLVRHVPLSSAQIWKLENSVVDHQNKTLHNDYRRTQPLNNRVVETNLINLPNQGTEFQLYINKLDDKLEYLRRLIEKKNRKEKHYRRRA